jgi:hypothetical protein
MVDYFFSGNQYIRVTRNAIGAGTVDTGYPKPISNWGWGAFGANGIDAALYTGSKCFFFVGNQYIRVSRGVDGAGTVDPGYPKPISAWGWGAFGANGIDAALYSVTVCYFFSGTQFIRVLMGETEPGVVDVGYPRPISDWRWGAFGASGIDAALYSGPKCYFFSGSQYLRVSRSDQGPGILDAGYPKPISDWGWGAFGANGIKGALYSGGPLVPAPLPIPNTPYGTTPGGLGSNSNYFFYSPGTQPGTCNNLTGLSVTVNVDVDIISSNGFGFQINAYSRKPATAVNPPIKTPLLAQQYGIRMYPKSSGQPPQLSWVIDNGPTSTNNILIGGVVAPLPDYTLPAQYTLTISLQNDPTNGNIIGATFAATDNTGKPLGNPQNISLLPYLPNVAPVVAFQMNLVSPGGSGFYTTTLTSGADTMTYTISEQLLAVSSTLTDCAPFHYITDETANSTYGQMPSTPSQTLTQSFQASVLSQ